MRAINHFPSALEGWHSVVMELDENDIEHDIAELEEWFFTNGISIWYIRQPPLSVFYIGGPKTLNERWVEVYGGDHLLLYLAFA